MFWFPNIQAWKLIWKNLKILVKPLKSRCGRKMKTILLTVRRMQIVISSLYKNLNSWDKIFAFLKCFSFYLRRKEIFYIKLKREVMRYMRYYVIILPNTTAKKVKDYVLEWKESCDSCKFQRSLFKNWQRTNFLAENSQKFLIYIAAKSLLIISSFIGLRWMMCRRANRKSPAKVQYNSICSSKSYKILLFKVSNRRVGNNMRLSVPPPPPPPLAAAVKMMKQCKQL
jgi:hypothetical protein